MRGTRRRERPSISGLKRIHSDMVGILRALGEASARAAHTEEKRKISLAKADLDTRLARVGNALARAKLLREKRAAYRARIAATEQKIKDIVGRQCRAGERWLRKWKRL